MPDSPAPRPTTDLPGSPLELRDALAAWYARERRDLPWRRTQDAYAVWLSEVMLQQTTVAAVIPYWERFLRELPDLAALAAAPEEDVLRLWSGLGYYRRARNLQRAARALVAAGQSSLPATLEGLRALPGIGAYTAAAIGSICFGLPAAVVDGNVQRVVTRLAGLFGDPRRAATARAIAAIADGLLDPAAPGDSNQALMELGATVCTPRAPRCAACPWTARCRAAASGDPERWPESAPRAGATRVLRVAALADDGAGRLLARRIPGGRNAGLWELPAIDLREGPRAHAARVTRALRDEARARFGALGLDMEIGDERCRVRHAVTRYSVLTVLLAGAAARVTAVHDGWTWKTPADLLAGAITGETRKLLQRL